MSSTHKFKDPRLNETELTRLERRVERLKQGILMKNRPHVAAQGNIADVFLTEQILVEEGGDQPGLSLLKRSVSPIAFENDRAHYRASDNFYGFQTDPLNEPYARVATRGGLAEAQDY